VLDFVQLGASLSLRSFARFGSRVQARSISVFNDAGETGYQIDVLSDRSTEIKKTADVSGSLQLTRALSMPTTGANKLHGLWLSDEVIATSDGSTKTNIRNLEEYTRQCTLPNCKADQRQQRNLQQPLRRMLPRYRRDPGKAGGPVGNIEWVLRELRPVAFRYKDAPEPSVRFGFLAEELQKLIPEVVRNVDQGDSTGTHAKRGVVYQDLIALLTSGLQAQQSRLEQVEQKELPKKAFSTMSEQIAEMAVKIKSLEQQANLRDTEMYEMRQLHQAERQLHQAEMNEFRQLVRECCGKRAKEA